MTSLKRSASVDVGEHPAAPDRCMQEGTKVVPAYARPSFGLGGEGSGAAAEAEGSDPMGVAAPVDAASEVGPSGGDDSDVDMEGVDLSEAPARQQDIAGWDGDDACCSSPGAGTLSPPPAVLVSCCSAGASLRPTPSTSTSLSSPPLDAASPGAATPMGGDEAAMAEGDQQGYKEIMTERERELEALRQSEEGAAASGHINTAGDLQKRLEFLVAQSEIFTQHFLERASGGRAVGGVKARRGAGGGGSRTKVSEKAEDKLMMTQAQTGVSVTRLTKQPDLIQSGTMRGYQLEALNWLIKLHDNNINGILADEMGLGKTLETIALLAYLRRGMLGPHVIIVPKSTVGNWMLEFKRWCPSINVAKLLGDKHERKAVCETVLLPLKFDVVVTSYECVLKEKATLSKIHWKYLIIDEAHRIKNEKSALSKQVRLMRTRFRLLLTGTPLQNNLHELWALLNFLLPDVFFSADDFDQWFNVSGDSEQQDNVISKLHTVLRPFMLRRIKADVERDLPPKKEIKLYVPLTALQRDWYKKVLTKDAVVLNALGGPDRSRLLNILMQLRKVCNHPYLFAGAEEGPPYQDGPHLWENSTKMSLLHKLLPRLKAQGSRVLIFSQMTRLLDIMEDYLAYHGHAYCRIDGSTSGAARDAQMEAFNKPRSRKFCFLLSTRAGGLGINLQTADTVVLYDSDWNPQVDLQAMDRAHRIGQTKRVTVFRFVCEGTVEEKVVERAERKLFLDAAVIQQGHLAQKNAQLSKEELADMVRFGADDILRADTAQGIKDEDIEALLRRGEEKTQMLKDNIEKDMRHSLANFSLTGDGDTPSLFNFEGQDYKATASTTGAPLAIHLPAREHKTMDYNLDKLFRELEGKGGGTGAPRGRPKGFLMQDHQFFDRAKLGPILEKEAACARQLQTTFARAKELHTLARKAVPGVGEDKLSLLLQAQQLVSQADGMRLTPEEVQEKERLMEEGFPKWTKKHLQAFLASLEKFGRDNRVGAVDHTVAGTDKTVDDVWRYYDTFFARCTELADHSKIMERIERGDHNVQRAVEMKAALAKKMARHPNLEKPKWLAVRDVNCSLKTYTKEEDEFLIYAMHSCVWGKWADVHEKILDTPQCDDDWWFKRRTPAELQRHGTALVELIEKENEAAEAAAAGKKRKSAGAGSKAAKKAPSAKGASAATGPAAKKSKR